jgi:hypothetical protein
MDSPLYLTDAEKSALLAMVPANLKSAVEKAQNEVIDSYEGEQELASRTKILGKDPKAKELAEKINAGQLDSIEFDDVDGEVLPQLFYCMGVVGMSVIIAIVMEQCKDQETLESLTMLTNIRHQLKASVPAKA